jgi:hypothetical protein
MDYLLEELAFQECFLQQWFVLFGLYFFYAYTQKKPEALPAVKEAILDRRMAFYEQNKDEITEEELAETKKNLDTVFTQKMQIRATIFMLFSMGILGSSGLALLMGRNPKEIANDMDGNQNA